MLTGVWTQWPALEEHKIQVFQELAEATCSGRGHGNQMGE
jgi:hypothetical protein